MSYNNNIIQTLGVDDESTYGKKLSITVATDTLGMCTISFGTSYSIRIPEDDVDALRDVLYTASTKLMAQRNAKQVGRREGNGEGREWEESQDLVFGKKLTQAQQRYLDLAQCSEV